jgi:hypothetical protein
MKQKSLVIVSPPPCKKRKTINKKTKNETEEVVSGDALPSEKSSSSNP